MAQFFDRRYPRRYFFSLPGAILRGKGRRGYDGEGQNFIVVYGPRFLEHLAGVGVNSFFKPRTHD